MAKRFVFYLAVALIIALLSAVAVSAITITVDGSRESAWDGGGSFSDGNEGNINDNVDIATFQWTNDTSNFYFLVAVQGPPPLMPDDAPIDVCLDTDNNLSTNIPASNTIQRNRCSYNTGVSGIDTVVRATNSYGMLHLRVFDVTQDRVVLKGTGTLGYNQYASNPVIEMGVPLNLLGYGSGVCPSTIPLVVYYDGGDTNPDDNLPDSGSIDINCDPPTAVTVSSFKTASGPGENILPVLGLVAGLLVAGAVVVIYRRV